MSTMQYLLPFMKLVYMTIAGKTAVDVKGRNSLEIIDLSRRSARSSTSLSAAWAGRTGDLDLDLVFFLAEEDVALDFFLGGIAAQFGGESESDESSSPRLLISSSDSDP